MSLRVPHHFAGILHDAFTALLRHRLLLGGVVVFFVWLLGTSWYALIEGWSLLDAAFMATETMTTVGYGQVHPLDTSGMIFTIVYIPLGVGVVFYAVGLLVEDLVADRLAEVYGLRRLTRRVRRMNGHTIICGYGRVGQEIAEELERRGQHVLVIELDSERLEAARAAGHAALQGDATEEAVLRSARVESARALIAAADSDAGNAFIALTGRALNASLLIIARAGSASGEQRLRTAGADRVISPTQIAGRRMALAAVQPLMVDFLDSLSRQGATADHLLAEFIIEGDAASLAGRALSDAFEGMHSCRVLGVERASGQLVVAPGGTTILEPGDRLMIYGEARELERLATASSSRRTTHEPAPATLG